MAVNTNKRIPVKWIRDKAKSAYEKNDRCHICGTLHELELHHLASLTLLLAKWSIDKGIPLDTDEQVKEVREEFIEEHHKEIYSDVYTLCNKHHLNLHKIFGKAPTLSTVPKQEGWILKQRERFYNELESIPEPVELVREREPRPERDRTTGGVFSKLINAPFDFSSFRTS